MKTAQVEGVLAQFLDSPTAWGILVLGVIFVYFWRRDISSPEKNASNAILSGAAAHSANVYEIADQALRAALRSEKRFNALIEYTRLLQGTLLIHEIPVPPMPDDVLEAGG